MKTELLYAKDIVKISHVVTPLQRLDLHIYKGEILGALGLHSSGASTMINVLSGLLPADRGYFFMQSKMVQVNTVEQARKLGIYCIRTTPMMVEELTLLENIAMQSNEMDGFWSRRVKHIIPGVIGIIQKYGIEFDLKQQAKQLSNYEKNIFEIVRAIAGHASLLILNGILDTYTEQEKEKIFNLLRQLSREGIAFLIFSNKVDLLLEISDRLLVMNGGYVGRIFYKEEYHRQNILHVLTNQEQRPLQETRKNTGENLVIQIHNLSVNEFGKTATFQVNQGEVMALTGEKQEECYEILAQLSGGKKTKGEICLDGKRIILRSKQQAILAGIGIITGESRKEIFPNLTLMENLLLMQYRYNSYLRRLLKKKSLRFLAFEYAEIFQIPRNLLIKRVNDIDQDIKNILPFLRWIVAKPKVLLLEDPFADADAITGAKMVQYIRLLQAQKTAVIFYSPFTIDLSNLCNSIYDIESGTKQLL